MEGFLIYILPEAEAYGHNTTPIDRWHISSLTVVEVDEFKPKAVYIHPLNQVFLDAVLCLDTKLNVKALKTLFL